jgi:hypothetical protein
MLEKLTAYSKSLKASIFNQAGLTAGLLAVISSIVFVCLYTEKFGYKLSSNRLIWAHIRRHLWWVTRRDFYTSRSLRFNSYSRHTKKRISCN